MTDLETKREAARAKLAEVGQLSTEARKNVMQGAQSAWDDLEKAFQGRLKRVLSDELTNVNLNAH